MSTFERGGAFDRIPDTAAVESPDTATTNNLSNPKMRKIPGNTPSTNRVTGRVEKSEAS
jgi:hypothetical protein